MGSMIYLAVGRLEVDWGKNFGFSDHSPLFQETDVKQVPYYYAGDLAEERDEDGNPQYEVVIEYQEGMSKPLGEVVERIDLLGHTLAYCRKEYELHAAYNSFDTDVLTFDQLAEALATIDVNKISADYGEGVEDFGKFFRRYLFQKLNLQSIVGEASQAQWSAGYSAENLSAYTIIRLLSFNSSARNLPVNWQFSNFEQGGWARRDQFIKPLDQSNRFLIVTEGSSDAGIIKHALKLLKPHVADFFDFVDMKEGYPFSGTGNLYNFTKGLIGISVQNNIIVLYDNDTEGVASYNRTNKLNIPKNMRVLKLPDLPEFEMFPTVGPSGTHVADINGQAAAIECYLDVGSDAAVRWTLYNKDLNTYQGEIVSKGDHAKRFYATKSADEAYNFTKISAVLNMIISACCEMREVALLAEVEKELSGFYEQSDEGEAES